MEQLRYNRAFSTVELMIAMGIMVLVLTAVIMTSFGSQSFLTGSQTNAEAIKIAQGMLEEEQALSRKDFNLVNSETETPDDIYKKSITVKPQTDIDDYFSTKEVTAKVTWEDERKVEQKVEITTLISNFDASVGGNTCYSDLSDSDLSDPDANPAEDWSIPEVKDTYSFPAGTTVTDMDAYGGKLYVTALTTVPTDSTFYIFDISGGSLTYKGSIDTTGNSVSSGASAVTVAKNSLGNYAYVANAYGANFNTCTPEGPNCSQLQVLDVSNSSSPSIVKNYKLPSITSSSGGAGNSIFYKNGYIYLGLTSTGNSNPEFNIVDVHNPSSPSWLSGKDLGSNDVNALLVKGSYAYIASADSSQQLKVVDIHDPLTLPAITGFSGAGGNGKSIYAVGNSIYLGTATGSGSRYYYDLDATDPKNIPITPLVQKTFSASVDGVIVRDTLAFALTKTALEIIKATDASPVGTLALSGSTGTIEPSFDCEGNYLYVGYNNGSNGKIEIIKSGP